MSKEPFSRLHPIGKQRQLKYVATINDETLSEETDPEYQIQYVDISNVDSSGRMREIVTFRFEDAPSRARRRVRDGDVIISTVRTYLQAIAPIQSPPENLIASTGFAVVRPGPALDSNYSKYALCEPRFLMEVEKRSVGVSYPAINTSDLGSIQIQVHPLARQRAIADTLDRDTARIDVLVSEKERLLDLLAEKRRALVTRAVTRGLNPRVKLRHSGIPWLGEIPAHWETWKIGHLAEVGNGSTPSRRNAAYWSGGKIPWLNSSVVNRAEVAEADQFVTALAARECHLPRVKSGSVLVAITGQGKTRGQAAVLSFDATINQHLAFIRPNQSHLLPWFLRWTLFAAYDFLRSISDDAGGTKGALTCEEVASLRVPVPPIREQTDILASVARSVERLDALRAVANNTISLIKERRSALISVAVTGDIDARSRP